MLSIKKIKLAFDVEKETSFFLLIKDCLENKPTGLESKITKYWNKDDITYFTQVGKVLYVDYLHVWSIFEHTYGMSDDQIEKFIKRMMIKYYNLDDITPEIRY